MKRRFWYWITDALALLVLLGATVFVLVRFPSLPEQVPAHFGARGEITDWSGKSSLILVLVLSWVMLAGMEVLSLFPQSWNIPRRTPRAYQAAADAMAVLRLTLALLFGYLEFCTALCRGLGVWAMPAMLALVAGDVLYMLVQSFRG